MAGRFFYLRDSTHTMLRKIIYPHIETTLNNIASKLHEKKFTPNQLTLTGLVINLISGCVFASGHFIWGGLIAIVASWGDMLDGPLARTSGKTSKFGAFFDSTLDRYSDFFIFGGIAAYYALIDERGYFFLVMGIIVGAFTTSYCRARAENFIESCAIGLFERTERLLVLAVGVFIPVTMPFILWFLFIGTNATTIYRIVHVYKKLNPQN